MDSITTHINDLPDDVLIKILWPSEQSISCRSESDDLWNSVAPKPGYLVAHTTSEELCRIRKDTPISTPPASADASRNLFIASICGRWRRLAKSHVLTLLVKENRVVSHRNVLNAVACFPSLTHLHLSEGSVETLDDSFLADLARSCPRLRALHVGKLLTAVELRHGRNDHVMTESGLDNFFRHCPQLEQLSLQCLEETLNPPPSFFQLQHLSVLSLTTPFILKAPNLSSLSSLTALSIETYSLHYHQLSSLLHLTNLTHLSLPDQIRLFTPDPPAFPLAQLPALESLKFGLYGAPFSVLFPLGSPFLKRLHLNKCYNQERLPDSIGHVLPRLQELAIHGCRTIELTDEFTALMCLESLTISSCNMSLLPENFGNLPALKTLVLHELPLLRLPASFTRLASLETFFLLWCKEMSELPGGGLTSLQTLCLSHNSQKELPSSFMQLPSLTRLGLDRCGVAELPAGMAEMTNLQELSIRECQAIRELPEFVTALTSLQVLRIQHCHYLSSVPKRLDSLTRLKQLELRGFELRNKSPQALPLSLQALYYKGNQQLVSQSGVSALTELRELCLGTVGATYLEAISDHLSDLEHLEFALGYDAEESLSSLARLPRLRTLTLNGVRSIKKLVGADGSALQELRQLNIHTYCCEFTELPAAITTLHHLTSLQVHGPKLSSLPDAFGSFPRLRRLDLSRCSSLTYLPASLTQLSSLHELNVSFTSIRLLPPNFARLSRLKKLDITYCKHLEALLVTWPCPISSIQYSNFCFPSFLVK